MTVNLPEDLDEQAKAAYWAVRDRYRSYSDWVGEALRDKIEAVRAEVKEIPPRPDGEVLPTGRPLSPPRRPSDDT